MKKIVGLSLSALVAFFMVSCTQTGHEEHDQHNGDHSMLEHSGPAITRAICVLYPTENSEVTGTVTFTKTDKGMKVVAEVTGLTPGKHGFHIHQYGDCSSPDAKSAGGHFNPHGMKHAGPMDHDRHTGDMGNLVANEEGVAQLEMVMTGMSFEGENNILGRGIIVHAGEDDLVSQPTGDAGGRVACGTIGVDE